MKKLGQIVKWLLAAIASLFVTLIASWWLIPDETLNPVIEKLTAAPSAPPAAENAYFLLWGLKASSDLDPHVAGQKIIAEHERLVAAKANLADYKIDQYLGSEPLSFEPAIKRCDPSEHECLEFYQGMRQQIEADFEKYASYIERYRTTRRFPHFYERVASWAFFSPFPPYESMVALSSLVDGKIALQVASPGTRKAALDELAAELHLWRRIIRDSDALLTQMISTAVLHRKYALASGILRAYPDTVRQYPETMAKITSPLLAKEINLVRALENEFRLGVALYRDLAHSMQTTRVDYTALDKLMDSVVFVRGYKPNATINRSYSVLQENAQFYARTPKQILDERTAFVEKQQDFNAWAPSVIFYNPVGKVLVSVGTIDLSDYSFRLHDLIARSRLLDLQRRIIEQNVQPQLREQFLADADLMNPYTEKTFELNAAKNSISFAGHGTRYLKNGRVSVELPD